MLLVFVKHVTDRGVIGYKIGRRGALPSWINRVCYNYGTVHYSKSWCFSAVHHTNATTVECRLGHCDVELKRNC